MLIKSSPLKNKMQEFQEKYMVDEEKENGSWKNFHKN